MARDEGGDETRFEVPPPEGTEPDGTEPGSALGTARGLVAGDTLVTAGGLVYVLARTPMLAPHRRGGYVGPAVPLGSGRRVPLLVAADLSTLTVLTIPDDDPAGGEPIAAILRAGAAIHRA